MNWDWYHNDWISNCNSGEMYLWDSEWKRKILNQTFYNVHIWSIPVEQFLTHEVVTKPKRNVVKNNEKLRWNSPVLYQLRQEKPPPHPIKAFSVSNLNIFRLPINLQFWVIFNNDIRITIWHEKDFRSIKLSFWYKYSLIPTIGILTDGIESLHPSKWDEIDFLGHKVTNATNLFEKSTTNEEKANDTLRPFYLILGHNEKLKKIDWWQQSKLKPLKENKISLQCTNSKQLYILRPSVAEK